MKKREYTGALWLVHRGGADLAERPAASAPERRRYLERMTGESMSDSTREAAGEEAGP